MTFCFSHRIESLLFSLSYLDSTDEIITEHNFKKEDVINTLSQYQATCKDIALNYVARVTAARKYIEITEGPNDTKYCLLSGLLHGRNDPTLDEEGTNPISAEEKLNCEGHLTELFGEPFSYDVLLSYFIDKAKLIADYGNITDRFSKVVVTRRLLEIENDVRNNFTNSKEERDVTWDFICQSFHVESTHFYSIRDFYSIEVPEYIIEICDSLVEMIKNPI